LFSLSYLEWVVINSASCHKSLNKSKNYRIYNTYSIFLRA